MEKTFDEVVKPVMEWLEKNKHPHTKIIIDSTSAEMVEGVECINTDKFQRNSTFTSNQEQEIRRMIQQFIVDKIQSALA